MTKLNPHQAAQSALVFNHLVLDIDEIDREALTRFCKDPESNERIRIIELFTVKIKLLTKVAKVPLPATTEKKTSNCFLGDRYYYRDHDLDNWLPEVQPAGKAEQFSSKEHEKEMKFKKVAAVILGIKETSDLDLMAKALIENGHTVVLPQIKSLIERTDAGKNTGLNTNGYVNFFFVINKEGGVSVVSVYRVDGRRWFVGIYHFGDDVRWGVGYRVFSHN